VWELNGEIGEVVEGMLEEEGRHFWCPRKSEGRNGCARSVGDGRRKSLGQGRLPGLMGYLCLEEENGDFC
jgi:hypothetical protein